MAIFWTGCLTGFIFQSKEVCEKYFKYKTTIDTTLMIPDQISTPSLSVCHLFLPILNRTEYEKYSIRKDPPTLNNPLGWNERNQLTIEQIFNLTKDGRSTVEGCGRRQPSMWTFKKSSSCKEEIAVKKFIMQEFVCYTYSFPDMPTLTLMRLAQAYNYINTAYDLSVGDVPTSSVLYIFAHPSNGLPLFSRNYGKQVDRQINRNGSSKPNRFFVTVRLNHIRHLPPPYETACTNEDSYNCHRLCVIENMEDIYRFPFTEIATTPVNLKQVSMEDMENNKTNHIIENIYGYCQSKCYRILCDFHFGTTNVHSYFVLGGRKNQIEFRLLIPDSPSIDINYKAAVSFLDFFVYMCSSFGLWFGLSVASFNPNKFKCFSKCNKVVNCDTKMNSVIEIVSELQRKVNLLESALNNQ